MNRHLLVIGFFVCAILSIYCSFSAGAFMQAQTRAPYPPFTAEQARLGKELALKSQEIRKGITNLSAPADPFKIIGNLYFVGDANGEVFLLTGPQGHIMMGAGDVDS